MWDLLPLLLAAGLIVLWSLVVFAAQRKGLLERRGLTPVPTPAGPFLMWKTVRGRRLIERVARPTRFWRAFGDLAIVLVALRGERVAQLTRFAFPKLFPLFGLPSALADADAPAAG